MENLFKNEDVAIIKTDEWTIEFMSDDGKIYTLDYFDKDFDEKFANMMDDPKMHLLMN